MGNTPPTALAHANLPEVEPIKTKDWQSPTKVERIPVPRDRVFCRKHGNWKATNVSNMSIGIEQSLERGWKGAQVDALIELWACESSWNHQAQNPTSTAYGIAQFLNSTWQGVNCTKTTHAPSQIRCGLDYIAQRYGTPQAALQWHTANNWY